MVRFRELATCLLSLTLVLAACEKDDDGGLFDPDGGNGGGGGSTTTPYGTGLLQGGTPSAIPVQANFGFGTGQLPAKVDLTMHFPPVGDQGSYGTCVAWAVGYNFKTALNAIDAGEQGSALADPAKQGSARYLFTTVPDTKKSADCNGMLFDPAFEVLQQEGLASLAEVPYTNLGNCARQLAESSWAGLAADNKVANYRRVEGSLEAVKRTLADKVPVVFGAKLGSAFMQWSGDGVLDTEGTFDPNFQHAYHAMVIAGYDDAKGARGAFRVVNSWAGNWGDAGSIWIDYDFFMREMLMKGSDGKAHLYVASNGQGSSPDDRSNDPPSGGSAELLTWMTDDFVDPDGASARDRVAQFDIYNFGDRTAAASSEWDIYYVYYNAFDASDWGVLFQDRMTPSVDGISCDDSGCALNADLPAQSSLGTVLFGAEGIQQGYTMPNITGDYFLLMVADGEEEIPEYDEFDNYFFPSLVPISIQGGNLGLRMKIPTPDALIGGGSTGQAHTVTAAQFADGIGRTRRPAGNAYSVKEVSELLSNAKRSGEFARRARAAVQREIAARNNGQSK